MVKGPCKTNTHSRLHTCAGFLVFLVLLSVLPATCGISTVDTPFPSSPPTNSTIPSTIKKCGCNKTRSPTRSPADTVYGRQIPAQTYSPASYPGYVTSAPTGGPAPFATVCSECGLYKQQIDLKSEMKRTSDKFIKDYDAALQDIVCKPQDEPLCSEAKRAGLASLEEYKASAAKSADQFDELACVQKASGLDATFTCPSGSSTQQRRSVQIGSRTLKDASKVKEMTRIEENKRGT